jgi:hypothetical protein
MSFRPMAWGRQLLIAIDQLLNVLVTPFSGGAYADETLSSRSFRAKRAGKLWGRIAVPLIDLAFAWERKRVGHCQRSYWSVVTRAYTPHEKRKQ